MKHKRLKHPLHTIQIIKLRIPNRHIRLPNSSIQHIIDARVQLRPHTLPNTTVESRRRRRSRIVQHPVQMVAILVVACIGVVDARTWEVEVHAGVVADGERHVVDDVRDVEVGGLGRGHEGVDAAEETDEDFCAQRLLLGQLGDGVVAEEEGVAEGEDRAARGGLLGGVDRVEAVLFDGEGLGERGADDDGADFERDVAVAGLCLELDLVEEGVQDARGAEDADA